MGGMEMTRYRECLTADFARLRAAVADVDAKDPVPSCPGWAVSDLVTHVAEVYLHKTESMRRGAFPEPWPPDLSGEEPLPLLDRSYAQLLTEFDARPASEPTAHWYEPDPTVGCLLRRMAQETVIHRVDAELAAGAQVTPVPADLALDGVDEILIVMLAYMSRTWPQAFADLPGEGAGDAAPALLEAGGRRWRLTPTSGGVTVTGAGAGTGEAAVTVSADPQQLLLWLWGRADDAAVTIAGDPAELARLRGLLHEAAQ